MVGKKQFSTAHVEAILGQTEMSKMKAIFNDRASSFSCLVYLVKQSMLHIGFGLFKALEEKE